MRNTLSNIPSLFAVTLVLFFSAATDSTRAAEYDGLPASFFEFVAKDNFSGGIEIWGESNPGFDKDTVDEIKRKAEKQIPAFGKYCFHETLREEKIGTRLSKVTYIVGYELNPLEITVTYYRPKDKWFVSSFNLNSPNNGGFKTFLRQ